MMALIKNRQINKRLSLKNDWKENAIEIDTESWDSSVKNRCVRNNSLFCKTLFIQKKVYYIEVLKTAHFCCTCI